MKIKGIIKNTIVIVLDFVFLYLWLGIEVAMILTGVILIYAWSGGYMALWKDGAVEMTQLNEFEYLRLKRATDMLTKQVKELSGNDISNIKYYMVPTDTINAYSYGRKRIGITRGALQVSDGVTLNAILSHEISHSLRLDAVFSRIIFANVMGIMLFLSLASVTTTVLLWIVFVIMGIFQKGSWFSLFCANGITKLIKEVFHLFQHVVAAIYKAIMGMISRGCEYRADRYACMLGYGTQLGYFLETFVAAQDEKKKTITEVIYDTHPSPYKRVARIRQYEQDNGSALKVYGH